MLGSDQKRKRAGPVAPLYIVGLGVDKVVSARIAAFAWETATGTSCWSLQRSRAVPNRTAELSTIAYTPARSTAECQAL